LDSRKKRKFDKADSQQRQTMIKGWENFLIFLKIQKKNFFGVYVGDYANGQIKGHI